MLPNQRYNVTNAENKPTAYRRRLKIDHLRHEKKEANINGIRILQSINKAAKP